MVSGHADGRRLSCFSFIELKSLCYRTFRFDHKSLIRCINMCRVHFDSCFSARQASAAETRATLLPRCKTLHDFHSAGKTIVRVAYHRAERRYQPIRECTRLLQTSGRHMIEWRSMTTYRRQRVQQYEGPAKSELWWASTHHSEQTVFWLCRFVLDQLAR